MQGWEVFVPIALALDLHAYTIEIHLPVID